MSASECVSCRSSLPAAFLSLGEQALANEFLAEPSPDQVKYELSLTRCPKCSLVQLTHVVSREQLFRDYAYFTSTSPQLHQHFRDYAATVVKRFPDQVRRGVVEVASNDGLLLRHVAQMTETRVLGIDPARNIAAQANDAGIETWPLFFDEEVARRVRDARGTPGVVIANNVLAHVPDPVGFCRAVAELLDDDGVFVAEVAYLGDMLSHGDFTSIYHEHVSYFSLRSLTEVLRRAGLFIFDVEHVDTQGGSLRVYASREAGERDHNLHEPTSHHLQKFALRSGRLRLELLQVLVDSRRIVAYGASAKASVLLQYCGLGASVRYVTDEAPSKQGKFMPGMRVAISPTRRFHEDSPDTVLVTAWNYAESIIEKEKWFVEHGGRFVVPLPELRVIGGRP